MPKIAAVLCLLGAAAPLRAEHHRFGDTDGSDATSDDAPSSPSPGPSPAHRHRHHHTAASPSPLPAVTPDTEAAPGADATPASLAKRRHHAASADDAPAPAPDDGVDATPTPRHRHSHPNSSPTDTGQTPAPDTAQDPGVSPSPAKKRHHHTAEPDVTTIEAAPSATPASSVPDGAPKPHPAAAPDASLEPAELREFAQQPARVQSLIRAALDLTHQDLTYTFSSDDPANGGMDCSGFIFYVLNHLGVKDVPRDASGQYTWVRKANQFQAVISRKLDGFELNDLRPGDLLFWSGTYKTDKDPPVTHTMIYLGREKSTGNRVMVGSSDGRSYHGLQRWGVSVFDFKAPASAAASPSPGRSSATFIGYAHIPDLQSSGGE